jgi:hypothetical protein|tara:strand:- start:262 stop:1536 length:1275 start_codon:yes stop_codon:yes gene_type:complete
MKGIEAMSALIKQPLAIKRMSTIYNDDIYTTANLAAKVISYLSDKKMKTPQNFKVNNNYDKYFVGTPKFIEIRIKDLLFDKVYQRFDVFSPQACINHLNSGEGFFKQVYNPINVFLRPEGMKYKNGKLIDNEKHLGYFTPDGQHVSTMMLLANNENPDTKIWVWMWEYSKDTTLEQARYVESMVYDVDQNVTTQSKESRLKVRYNNWLSFKEEGKKAKEVGDFLYENNLNCIDLFHDPDNERGKINSYSALLRINKVDGLEMSQMKEPFRIYQDIWNHKNKSIHSNTTNINVDVVSAITYVKEIFSTNNNGEFDRDFMVSALLKWTHMDEDDETKWTVSKRKDVQSLVKPFEPHRQIESGAVRIAEIYNKYVEDVDGNPPSYKSLLLNKKIIGDLKEKMLKELTTKVNDAISDIMENSDENNNL